MADEGLLEEETHKPNLEEWVGGWRGAFHKKRPSMSSTGEWKDERRAAWERS